MTDTNTILSLDSLDDLNAVDTAKMDVIIGGKLSGWVWTFAGPGHPKTVAQTSRITKERLHEDRQKEQAQVNGRKWKAPEETPDEKRAENITYVVERLTDWSAIEIGGKPFEFSEANARVLLSDPARISMLTQALEFLSSDDAFTKRSA